MKHGAPQGPLLLRQLLSLSAHIIMPKPSHIVNDIRKDSTNIFASIKIEWS